MAVKSTSQCLSNFTSQSGSNCSDVRFFECMDSFPGNLITGFIIVLKAVLLLPVNCWILWLQRTAGVTSSDFANLNQTIAEIISEISLTVFLAGGLINKKIITLISGYFCSTFLVGRPLFQSFFCVERYLAVVHPLVYLKYMKAPKIKLSCVGLVWLIILMFGWYLVDSYPNIPMWLSMGLYLALLFVCTSCSVMILWVLKRPKPGDGKEKEGAYQQKRKAFVAVTVILITLVFGYGTVSCVIVLRNQLSYRSYCLIVAVSWWTLLPNAVVQPYLYLSKADKLPCTKNI